MNPIVFAMMQGGKKLPELQAMPESDPMKEMLGNLFSLAPAILLTVLGLLVLLYDFAILRKKPSAERQSRLGWMTLFGVVAGIALQTWVMLPQSWYGLNYTNLYISMFSGTIAIDGVSAWMNLALLVLLALVIVQSLSFSFTDHWGEYFALLCWSAVGMMFLIASEELITLFLTLETMTLCLYMLASFEKSRRRSAEAGLKYFVYGSVSSALFLFGLSLIYGLTGSTRLDAIKTALEGGTVTSSIGLSGNIAGATAVLLVLVGFGFKIAAVPFHQWSPDTYEGAPAPVTSWIATGSKIASFIAMIKVIVGALAPWAMKGVNTTSPGWIGIIALISAVTMTYGNFAALAQKNLKRMLAYSSIAHAGYMLVGVLAASISTHQYQTSGPVLFYLIIYGFTTIGAFSVAAWLVRDKGTDEIEDLNGLGKSSPFLAVCIVLLMLSLIGMPPLAGFWGKLYMFMEAMNSGDKARLPLTWLVMLGLFNSVVSAFYYVRVLKAMFLREASGTPLGKAKAGIAVPIIAATLVAVGFGIYPGPLMSAMSQASNVRPTPSFHYEVTEEQKKKSDEEFAARKKKNDDEGRTLQAAGGGGGAPPAKGAGGVPKKKGGTTKKKSQAGPAAEPESKRDVPPR